MSAPIAVSAMAGATLYLPNHAQGCLKLPNGKALTGFNHEYKRHGTTTLFAALEVATGLVKAGHYQRRRRLEFLHFMNRVVAEHGATRDLQWRIAPAY